LIGFLVAEFTLPNAGLLEMTWHVVFGKSLVTWKVFSGAGSGPHDTDRVKRCP